MEVEVDGIPIRLVDTDDRNVIHIKNGGYERESLEAWARMVKPGMVALDIGAYTGLFSIVAALKYAHVVAFEPMPANRWRLGINAAQNKAHVKIYPAAVSDRQGHVSLHYNSRVPLTTGASLEGGVTAHDEIIVVDCVTIDALDIKGVTAIKIDVERHEPCVIKGAVRTIERDKPALLVETLDSEMRKQVLRLLPSYAIAAVLDQRNTMLVPK